MEYPLSINWVVGVDAKGRQLRSKISAVLAEANLGQYAEIGSPQFFIGKLVGVAREQIARFASAENVKVGFRDRWYKFEELETDGTFLVRQDRNR